MKLYYYEDACSRAPHIILRELGLAPTLVAVDTKSRTAADGVNFASLNPKGYVPALVLENGEVLTETIAVLEYLADLKPGLVAPPRGSFDRYRVLEWLSFIAMELHKNFTPLFIASTGEPAKEAARTNLRTRLDWLDAVLKGRSYLVGNAYSTADAYLYIVTGWGADVGVDAKGWPALASFRERIGARPAVQEAIRRERGG
jgi:glutathione S-transferase